MNENNSTMYQNIWGIATPLLKGEFTAIGKRSEKEIIRF